MARIIFGVGTSHGPMLSIASQYWPDRVLADRANPQHFFNGKTYTFDEMAELRSAEGLAAQSSAEVREQRYLRCQAAIRELGDLYERAGADVAVVVGNDQMEVFTPEHVPAFAVFWGPYVEGIPRTPEFLAKLGPGIARAELDRTPAVYTQYPCVAELGRHVIERATAEGFDVAQMTKLPSGEIGSCAVPHAYGFVYRRVMRDRVAPQVPVFVNTFYPPNQPTARRCWEFGRMLARAVSAWSEKSGADSRTVAFVASGGMTHFVVNEGFDHRVMEAMRAGDAETLCSLPEAMFQSGTSEIKNWIVVAGAMAEAGLRMRVVDYVACYRSEAGTGSGMGFAVWE
jgi:hypothetical protein